MVHDIERPPVPAGWAPVAGDDVIVMSMGGAAGKVAATSGPKGRVTVKARTHPLAKMNGSVFGLLLNI